MNKSVMFAIILFILIFSLPSLVYAIPGPRAYLTEQVKAHYSTDGTPSSTTYDSCDPAANPCRYGFLEVSVPNQYDVLQEVKLNLSSTTGTTLRYGVNGKSYIGYKATVSSDGGPHVRDSGNRLYVNTTETSPDDDYNITDTDAAPTIMLNATITNWQGGYDIYDDENIGPGGGTNVLNFTLNITNPSTTSLSGVTVEVQFKKDTSGTADSVNITSVPTSGGSGTPGRENTDSDQYYDKATWTGTLGPTTSILLNFNISTKDTINFDGDNVDLDSDGNGGAANYGSYSTSGGAFTGITITTKFSKGPVRQGIDMALQSGASGNWTIRGFIRNMANASEPTNYIAYNVTQWRLYEVNSTGYPETLKQAGEYNNGAGYLLNASDGRIYTTDDASNVTTWYDTDSSTKPYYASYFDWQVIWDETSPVNYYEYINTTYNLTTLYKIDMSNTKIISGYINPNQGGDVITINDTSTHVGNNNAPAKQVEILSVVPANTTSDPPSWHGKFDINGTSIKVYFGNSTGYYEIEPSNYTSTVTDVSSDGSSNGLVNITITDFSTVYLTAGGQIGHNLGTSDNEKIRLVYDILSNESMTVGDQYNFTGNTTMITPSGTPLTEVHQAATISVSAKRLIGYKEMRGLDPANPNLINVSIVIEAQTNDTNNKIAGIKFIDYIPNGTDIDGNKTKLEVKASVNYYNSGSWEPWVNGTDYIITLNGTFSIDGNPVVAYEFTNATDPDGGWYLGNGQMINVTYQMNVTQSGLYSVPVIIAGFDPLTGKGISSRAIGVIKVDIPKPKKPLEITQGDFEQAKRAVVGKSVLWIKDFTVFNPNTEPTNAKFEINTFKDTEKGYATYYNENGEKIEEGVDFDLITDAKKMFWSSKINPLETRNYEVRIFTPPVIEVDRDVEVLGQVENKKVKIKMDVFLKNFAEEKYKNVVLNLPISYEDIISVRDSFGNMLQFTGGEDSSSIIVGGINGGDIKTITIVYKQSYPTIIVTPRKEEYRAGRPVGLDILVINGGETIDYPRLEVEIYTPGMDVISSDIKELETMEPLKKTELTEEYFIPLSAPNGMYIASASFNHDFVTLARGTGNFFVTGGKGSEMAKALEIIILLIALVGSGFVIYKRIKAVREENKLFI